MRLVLLAAVFAAVIVLFAGCYKDKGDYSYHNINDITVSAGRDTFSVYQFDTLDIKPVITQRIPDEGILKYEWTVSHDFTRPVLPARIISTERNLHAQIALSPISDAYTLILKVTDSLTRVSSFYHFALKVSSVLSEGWVLLEHGSGHADISIIATNDTVYRHVFSAANPTVVLPADAFRVVSINSFFSGQRNYVLYHGGGYELAKNTFQVQRPYKDWFYSAPAVLHPETIAWPPYSSTICLVNDGGLYTQSPILGGNSFGDRLRPARGDYDAAPFVGGFAFGIPTIIFDQKNYRFLFVPEFGESLASWGETDSTQAFDMNNVQKKLIVLDGGTNFYNNAIFRNLNNDSCFIYVIDPTGGGPVANRWQPVLNSPDIGKADFFAMSQTVPQLYYAAGNKVYLYDIAANRSRLVYRFGDNEIVTALKMYYINDGFDHPLNDARIIAATYDGVTGRLYYFDLSGTGDIRGNSPGKAFTGFDRIVDLVYQQR